MNKEYVKIDEIIRLIEDEINLYKYTGNLDRIVFGHKLINLLKGNQRNNESRNN